MTTEPETSRLHRLADDAREPLRELYRELDQAVAALGPVCELSGRCCRFEEYGHALFVSEAEAAVLITDAPPPVRPLDSGATCPWQDSKGRCVARGARPLGCRVYFCDPKYEGHAPEISERFLARLKALCDARGWPWNYATLHRHLAAAQAEGALEASPDHAETARASPLDYAETDPHGQLSPDESPHRV